MAQLSKYRVLIAGVVSPLAALFLYVLVYSILKRGSSDLERDWLPRLLLSTLAMILPFLVTLFLAIKDRRQHTLSLSGKIGFAIAILSLGLAWQPMSDGILRWKQARNMALRDVARTALRHGRYSRERRAPERPDGQSCSCQHLGDLVRAMPQ